MLAPPTCRWLPDHMRAEVLFHGHAAAIGLFEVAASSRLVCPLVPLNGKRLVNWAVGMHARKLQCRHQLINMRALVPRGVPGSVVLGRLPLLGHDALRQGLLLRRLELVQHVGWQVVRVDPIRVGVHIHVPCNRAYPAAMQWRSSNGTHAHGNKERERERASGRQRRRTEACARKRDARHC